MLSLMLSSMCYWLLQFSYLFTFSLLPSEPNLLVRACNQLGQFLQHRETNLRYLALESMCTLASSEFSHEAVKTHIETVINALKVMFGSVYCLQPWFFCLIDFLFYLFKSFIELPILSALGNSKSKVKIA